jgi:hypothetical protein
VVTSFVAALVPAVVEGKAARDAGAAPDAAAGKSTSAPNTDPDFVVRQRLGAPPAERKPGAPATRADVARYLSTVRGLPTREGLLAQGPGVEAVLLDLERSSSLDMRLRLEALLGLAALGTKNAHDEFVRILDRARQESETDTRLVRQAALGLGWLRDSRAVERVAPLLYHDNEDVRLDAIVALVLTRSPEAITALEDFIEREGDVTTRRKAERQLASLRRSVRVPPPPRLPLPRLIAPPPPHLNEQPGFPTER